MKVKMNPIQMVNCKKTTMPALPRPMMNLLQVTVLRAALALLAPMVLQLQMVLPLPTVQVQMAKRKKHLKQRKPRKLPVARSLLLSSRHKLRLPRLRLRLPQRIRLKKIRLKRKKRSRKLRKRPRRRSRKPRKMLLKQKRRQKIRLIR